MLRIMLSPVSATSLQTTSHLLKTIRSSQSTNLINDWVLVMEQRDVSPAWGRRRYGQRFSRQVPSYLRFQVFQRLNGEYTEYAWVLSQVPEVFFYFFWSHLMGNMYWEMFFDLLRSCGWRLAISSCSLQCFNRMSAIDKFLIMVKE